MRHQQLSLYSRLGLRSLHVQLLFTCKVAIHQSWFLVLSALLMYWSRIAQCASMEAPWCLQQTDSMSRAPAKARQLHGLSHAYMYYADNLKFVATNLISPLGWIRKSPCGSIHVSVHWDPKSDVQITTRSRQLLHIHAMLNEPDHCSCSNDEQSQCWKCKNAQRQVINSCSCISHSCVKKIK
jgi:hypothetical protein